MLDEHSCSTLALEGISLDESSSAEADLGHDHPGSSLCTETEAALEEGLQGLDCLDGKVVPQLRDGDASALEEGLQGLECMNGNVVPQLQDKTRVRHGNAGAHSHKSFKSKRYFSGERLEPRPRLLAATSPHLANQLILLIHIPFAIQLST